MSPPYEVVVGAGYVADIALITSMSTLEGDWYPQFLKLYGMTQELSDKYTASTGDKYGLFKLISTKEYCVNNKMVLDVGVAFQTIFKDEDGNKITEVAYNAGACKKLTQ